MHFVLLIDDPAPGAIDAATDPILDLHSWYSLHTEDLECDAISTCRGCRDFLDVFVVLALGVLDHGVDGGEFLGTFGAAEVFGLLVVVEDDFVLEGLLAVEAEWTQAGHVSSLTPHLL